MSEISLTTPALLFPAISLLLLAYTNRYIAVTSRVRGLHAQYKLEAGVLLLEQLKILKFRIRLIRDMQLIGILSMLVAAFTMFLIYQGWYILANYAFSLSLILLLSSLCLSAYEIILSNKALFILLSDIKELDIKPLKF
jgi:hypothetical protein